MGGMTREDFYKCRLFEIAHFLVNYFEQKQIESRERWELARFQMAAMTDVKKIRFPWEKELKKEIDTKTKKRIEYLSNQFDQYALKNFK